MKRTLALLAALLLVFSLFAGCAAPAEDDPAPVDTAAPAESAEPTPESTEPDPVPTKVIALKGPTGIGLAYMMDQESAAADGFAFEIAGAPDDAAAAVISGSADIAAVPINLASTLYNKTEGGVTVLAVNTLGVLYVVENGDSVSSIADLAGKTLYATGQASTPEYVLNYLLEKNGIAEEVAVEYYAEHTELATLMAAGEQTLGMLPEPNVTSVLMQNQDTHIALNLTEEWNKVCDTDLVQGVFIVRNEYLEAHPEMVEKFLSYAAESAGYVVNNAADASLLVEKYGVMPAAKAAEKAIPNCNIVCITGDEMKADVSAMLNVLFDSNPKSVGGALPGDDFYYGASVMG